MAPVFFCTDIFTAFLLFSSPLRRWVFVPLDSLMHSSCPSHRVLHTAFSGCCFGQLGSQLRSNLDLEVQGFSGLCQPPSVSLPFHTLSTSLSRTSTVKTEVARSVTKSLPVDTASHSRASDLSIRNGDPTKE